MPQGLQVSNQNGFVQIDGDKQGFALFDTFRIRLFGGFSFQAYNYIIPKLTNSPDAPIDVGIARFEDAGVEAEVGIVSTASSVDFQGRVLSGSTIIRALAPVTAVTVQVALYRRVKDIALSNAAGDWGLEAYGENGEKVFDNRQYSFVVDNVVAGNYASITSLNINGNANSALLLNPLIDLYRPSNPNDRGRFFRIKRNSSNSYTIRSVNTDSQTVPFGGNYYSFVSAQLPPNQRYEFYSSTEFDTNQGQYAGPNNYYELGFDVARGYGRARLGNQPPNATWVSALYITSQTKPAPPNLTQGGFKFGISGIKPESYLRYIVLGAGASEVFTVGQTTPNGGSYHFYHMDGNTYWSWGFDGPEGAPQNTETERPRHGIFGPARFPLHFLARWSVETVGSDITYQDI